jgi:hypothetical protein
MDAQGTASIMPDNDQVEQVNRTIKEATVRCYRDNSHDQLGQHLTDFVSAYNFGPRLKTLRGLTPYEYICKAWTDEPSSFIHDPHLQSPGPNIYSPFTLPLGALVELLPACCWGAYLRTR